MATSLPHLHRPPTSASIAVLSTYPPTRCGLASFSSALVDALVTQDPGRHVGVVAIDGTRQPSGEVVATLAGGGPHHLQAAAAALNRFETVILQHEYGIFAGPDGDSAVALLERVVRPVITVLHTVLDQPTPCQRRVLEQVVDGSVAAVVMTEVAKARLLRRYVVDPAKVRVIPHGSSAPAGARVRRDERPLLLTWGLLGPGKGVELAIDALRGLRDLRPLPRYVVAGQTHPKVREQSGEAYRELLMARACDRDVDAMVEFDDRYLDRRALGALIQRASVVVLPYESREQVTSGVLVDALACGTPVVTTAFPHAAEVCARGAGIAVPHGDVDALAEALRRVIADRRLASRLRAAARGIGSELSWQSVAVRYAALADEVTGRNHPLPFAGATRAPAIVAAR